MDHFTSRRFNPLPTGDVLMKTARDYTPLEDMPESAFEAMLQDRRRNLGAVIRISEDRAGRDPARDSAEGCAGAYQDAAESMGHAKTWAGELRESLWFLLPLGIVAGALWVRYG